MGSLSERRDSFARLLTSIESALEKAPPGDANSIVDSILDDSGFQCTA